MADVVVHFVNRSVSIPDPQYRRRVWALAGDSFALPDGCALDVLLDVPTAAASGSDVTVRYRQGRHRQHVAATQPVRLGEGLALVPRAIAIRGGRVIALLIEVQSEPEDLHRLFQRQAAA